MPGSNLTYPIVDTNQSLTYNDRTTISPPAEGRDYYGQDAQYDGNAPAYQDNGDGTVTDLVTGLMWQQSPSGRMSWADAVAGADGFSLAGHDDWRLPTISELYSLILFSGDIHESSAADSTPFIDTRYFTFEYGDPTTGIRVIDSQYWSATEYVGLTYGRSATTFGVNFADGRIKGYPQENMEAWVMYVRGNTDYGVNDLRDNGDGTLTDHATGLMWRQMDSGTGMNWQEALSWAENLDYAGYDDWRLPNIKELQSIADYRYAPDARESTAVGPAIDPLFQLTNVGTDAEPDYAYYWSGTTHVQGGQGLWGSYMTFGAAWGHDYRNGQYTLADVHGAGAQRSDYKSGDPADYPNGFGPQYDVIGINNHVLVVRDADLDTTTTAATLQGSTTDDTLTGNGGRDDVVDGGAGTDLLVLAGLRAEWSLTHDAATATFTLTSGTTGERDTLTGVERLAFDDTRLALDLDLDGAAGNTVRVLGAAFGSGYLTAELVGIGLALFDAGHSLDQVCDLAVGCDLFLQLAGDGGNAAMVRTVYQNVVGSAPAQEEVDYYTGLLEGGMGRGTLLRAAAESDLTATAIGLTGLAGQGVEYQTAVL